LEAFRATAAPIGDDVRTLGWVSKEEVLKLLNKADVFVFPSYYEGMPNAVLEAMASGVPVVATPVGSLPDLIHSGENGFLTPIKDVPSLTEAVLFLLDQPVRAHEIGLAGRRAVEHRYDIKRVWRLYADALSRAASIRVAPDSKDNKPAPCASS